MAQSGMDAFATGSATMSSAMRDAVNYHRWVIDLIRPHIGRSLLEIGFGFGQYTRALAPLVERLVAIDVAPELLETDSPLPPHVELLVADLSREDFPDRVGRQAFDSAICLNVLEHIEDDAHSLRLIRETLEPGGRLVLQVPAHPALYGDMDALAGHHRRYTRSSLGVVLRGAGFAVQDMAYSNPIGGLGWWLNAKLVRTRDLSAPIIDRQILFFDRYIQPISRLLDPLTRGFFGQSLWAVARNPAPAA